MRTSVKVAGVLTALMLAGTGAAMAAPGDPGTVPGALVEIQANGARGWYIDANGTPKFLPKGPNATAGKSGDYPAMWFKGDSLGAGSVGPAGPQGPKGEPGDSSVVLKRTKVTLNADSPASQTVVVTGLPAKSGAVPEAAGSNSADVPASFGATVTVGPQTAANGSTSRAFTVTKGGFDGAESFVLDLWVIAVP